MNGRADASAAGAIAIGRRLMRQGQSLLQGVAILLLATLAARAGDGVRGAVRLADAKSIAEESQPKLRGLQDTIDASEARRKTLANDIATYKTDRARFETTLLTLTKKAADDDGRIADAETRLAKLTASEDQLKQSLNGRRAVIAEVLAALQRMGRKPPPALLVQPEDVLKAIRTSMLLGAVLPGMRAETEALAESLGRLAQTRRAIEEERRGLTADLAALKNEQLRLTTLIDARQDALGKAQDELAAERDKAKQLAEHAGSLKDLIGGMERESGAAAQAAQAAQKSDEKLAALMPNGVPPPSVKDPARLAPAVAFATTKGLLPLPVSGSVVRRFGEDDGLGSTEKGMLFATRTGSLVASPADGWIAYAGPYRSFGQLLILNAGGGYYIVLAGMDRVNVSLGQFVLAGEPVAAMGDGTTKTAAAVALGAVQPLLYVEFRKDGATIDPGPWWAKPELQRVRG